MIVNTQTVQWIRNPAGYVLYLFVLVSHQEVCPFH